MPTILQSGWDEKIVRRLFRRVAEIDAVELTGAILIQRFEYVGTRDAITDAGFDDDARLNGPHEEKERFAIEFRRRAEPVRPGKPGEIRMLALHPLLEPGALVRFQQMLLVGDEFLGQKP